MLGNFILDSGPNVCESADQLWMIALVRGPEQGQSPTCYRLGQRSPGALPTRDRIFRWHA